MRDRSWTKLSMTNRRTDRGEVGWVPAGAGGGLGGVAPAPGRDVPDAGAYGMALICAWCGCWIDGRAPDAATGTVELRVSHGMCGACRL